MSTPNLERFLRVWRPTGMEARFVAWEHFHQEALPSRTFNAIGHFLYEAGVEDQYRLVLRDMSDAELLAVPGVGRKGLRALRARFPYRPLSALLEGAR